MRRRKHRLPLSADKSLGPNNSGRSSWYTHSVRHRQYNIVSTFLGTAVFVLGNLSGSSDGPDPSSSDLSADTVIYMGPSDDATDGEHPPVYIPSINSGDNRCTINKALKGSTIDKTSKLPTKKSQKRNFWKFQFFLYSEHRMDWEKYFVFSQLKVLYQINELIALSVVE